MNIYNRKLAIVMLMIISLTTSSGCSSKTTTNQSQKIPARNDIFSDVENVEHENNKAVVNITLSLKSISSRFFEKYNKYIDPPLTVNFNIDGQSFIFDKDPLFENKNTVNIKDEEKGNGWRYNFNKKIYITPGRHRLIISIPVNNVTFESDVNFHAGINNLTVIPVYKKRPSQRPYRERNFSAGIQTLKIQID